MSGQRKDAGVAVAGLFAKSSATGGLAGLRRSESHRQSSVQEPRVRLGVELTESQVAFLRSQSRPSRTGGSRTIGAKFVAAGVLAAAIELLERSALDMHGVAAGDLTEMTERARDALLRASASEHTTGEAL